MTANSGIWRGMAAFGVRELRNSSIFAFRRGKSPNKFGFLLDLHYLCTLKKKIGK